MRRFAGAALASGFVICALVPLTILAGAARRVGGQARTRRRGGGRRRADPVRVGFSVAATDADSRADRPAGAATDAAGRSAGTAEAAPWHAGTIRELPVTARPHPPDQRAVGAAGARLQRRVGPHQGPARHGRGGGQRHRLHAAACGPGQPCGPDRRERRGLHSARHGCREHHRGQRRPGPGSPVLRGGARGAHSLDPGPAAGGHERPDQRAAQEDARGHRAGHPLRGRRAREGHQRVHPGLGQLPGAARGRRVRAAPQRRRGRRGRQRQPGRRPGAVLPGELPGRAVGQRGRPVRADWAASTSAAPRSR